MRFYRRDRMGEPALVYDRLDRRRWHKDRHDDKRNRARASEQTKRRAQSVDRCHTAAKGRTDETSEAKDAAKQGH